MIPLPTSVLARRRRSLVAELAGSGAVTIPPYLNDPAAVSQGITISSITADSLVYSNTSGSTACYGVPIPPAGSTVEFDITCSSTVYFRLDQEGDMTSPNFTELVPGGIPAGTQHVSVTVPSYTNRSYIGFRIASSAQSGQITNWRVTAPVVPAHPLQPYFDSGTIAIYLDSDGATLDGSGQVTAIANRGAGGAAFDATVTGNPIPLSGNTMQMSSGTGNCILATPADIMDVHMMWACSTEGLVSSMRFMGSANDEVRIGAIQAGSPPSAFLQFWSNRSGAGVSINPTPRIPIPTSGMHLFECEMSAVSQYLTAWFDGLQVATIGAVSHTAFAVDRIGQGTGGTLQFVGQMGGVLGVLTGRPDTAAAIAAVRSYWATRFGLVLS